MSSKKMKRKLRELNPLKGAVVTGFIKTEDDFGDEYLGIVFTTPGGKERVLFCLADDEGNGPGSFLLQ